MTTANATRAPGILDDEAKRVLDEELALLAKVRQAIARASTRVETDEANETESMRALRDDAQSTADDDLPGVLHELAVRQRLRAQRTENTTSLPEVDSPYVGHLVLEDERGIRDYALGSANLFDVRLAVRIVDWRTAPIAQVFYRYREGDEFEEEIAGKVVTGIVKTRRVVVIDGGELVRVLDGALALSRDESGWTSDAVSALAAGGSDTAARPGILGVGAGTESANRRRTTVTALLDAEQHAAIATPPDKPLLVIGSAGSGKTTVALHRLARLTATDPQRVPLERTRVIVPEEGLARLSRRLLAPLGARDAQVATLDAWAAHLTKQAFGSVPRLGDETPGVVARLKRHPALYDLFRREMAKLAPERTRTLPKARRVLADKLSDRAFLGRVIAASNGELPPSAIEETVQHTMRQLADPTSKQMRGITDERAKQSIDGLDVGHGETAGTLDPEDLPLLLALRVWSGELDVPAPYAHLVVDEAEDVSLFELDVMKSRLAKSKSVTLSGDDAQSTGGAFASWDRSMRAMGLSDPSVVRLSVSYRCPRPVVELAQRVLGSAAAPTVIAAREGAPVGIHRFPAAAQAQLFLAQALLDLVDREPRASIGVVASDEASAKRLAGSLARVPGARLIEGGEFSFEPGIDVTHVDAVKGLEWDYVVVADATADAYPDTPESRRRLHVAMTRASYQLWLVAAGTMTTLIDGPPG